MSIFSRDSAGLHGVVNDTTLITSPTASSMSPLESIIMDRCNALHEARAAGDADLADRLIDSLETLLEKYEASDAEAHPNAAWAVPHHRALVCSAAGQSESAVMYEEIALQHADTARRLEISHGNLAERCLRLERYDDALAHFLAAQQVAPTSVPIMLTGAQALHLCGYHAQAEKIFRALLARKDLLRSETDLTAYLDYEPRLVAMRHESPALDALMSAWEGVRDAR